ncbi:hypothetical protein AB835_08430 [Candidatus Endobugula sertula]|uniref:HD-GYP domain-containing protein n=1 Tax=Candidatus Endobugula sertula TaxID=62101 RepID=A0A1D2QPQ3_9GAMM|nr:hypothetical protein AB835_08430 [Candidatus Endobugula sertula]
MYVTHLDRPWDQTPFPVQGFYIRDLSQIQQLRAHCQYVVVDIEKGSASLDIPPDSLQKNNVFPHIKLTPIKADTNVYKVNDSINTEIVAAQKAYDKMLAETSILMDQAETHNLLSISQIKNAARDMVDTIVRHPDAFMWITRMRSGNDSPTHYLVRVAMWAVLLGRHLGLPRGHLNVIALGISLKDVGKALFPKNMRDKRDFQPAYITKSVEILHNIPSLNPKVINLVKTHCERINGSGIPQGLRGDDIDLLGKIAGIASFYDEVLYPDNAEYALSPSQAVSRLYEKRGVEFQHDLVVEFIRAIGLYATGTLVELSTHEIGIVVEQNSHRRLQPKVMMILDAEKKPLKKVSILDIYEHDRRRQKMIDVKKKRAIEKLEIIQDVEYEMYDLELDGLREQFVRMINEKKSLFSFLKKQARH